MSDAPYKSAAEALQAIHQSIAYWIEGTLENSMSAKDYQECIEFAELMRDLEAKMKDAAE